MEGLEFDLWVDLGCFRCFVVACLIGVVGYDLSEGWCDDVAGFGWTVLL